MPITKLNTLLDNIQYQILTGLIISDASIIFKTKESKTPCFSITNITKDFISDIQNKLPFKWHNVYIIPEHKRGNINAKESYILYSKADLGLLKERNRWYQYNNELQKFVKIIPEDLEISPIMLKYWFYGDGWSSYISRTSSAIGLCTNGFTYEECIFLQKKLKIINLDFNVNKVCNKNIKTIYNKNRNYILRTNRNTTIVDFFNYIGSCDIKGFMYKWKMPYPTIRKSLTPKEIIEIKTKILHGVSNKILSKEYDIDIGSVIDIKYNRIHKNILEQLNNPEIKE